MCRLSFVAWNRWWHSLTRAAQQFGTADTEQPERGIIQYECSYLNNILIGGEVTLGQLAK